MTFRRCWVVFGVVALGLLSRDVASRAADTAAVFVEALRSRGMHDLTLDYLERAQHDRLVGNEFRKRIPYERGITLKAQWRHATSIPERQRLAAEARKTLEDFATTAKEGALAADAQSQVASLLIKTATRELALLKQRPGTSAKNKAIRKEARQNFQDARDLLTKSEKLMVAELAKFSKTLDPKTQSKEIDQRLRMRRKLAQLRVVRSRLLHQMASTFKSGAKEADKLNEKGAKELVALYDKYSGFSFGLRARLVQGECYLDLQEYKKAIACFDDVIAQSGNSNSLRRLLTSAMMLEARCYIEQKQYAAVGKKQGVWLQERQNKVSVEPDVLAVKYQVAEAMRLHSALPKTEEAEKRQLLLSAKDLYRQVAKNQNEFQKLAQATLVETFGNEATERPVPETFADALQAAKDAINDKVTAERALSAAEKNNPAAVPALQETAEAGLVDAMHFLQLAQQLVDEETPREKLNETRWLAGWLLMQDEQYYRSAVLGSFLTRRYPADTKAPKAAQIAMISYQKIYQKARADAGDAVSPKTGHAAADKLKNLASFITRRWGETDLAESAFGLLLGFSIQEKEFSEALQLVDQLEASRQPVFRAKIGNAMWETQLRAGSQQESTIDRVAMQRQALQILSESFSALKGDASARDTLAATSLYLVQSKINAGNYAEAIQMLEDPQAGPIALSKTTGRVASRPVYAIEAYKSALRAYVSVAPPKTDKAIATMAELEKVAEKTSSGGGKLTRVYVNLGVQLKRQIKTLQGEGKTNESKRVSEAFVTFLDRLSQRGISDPIVRRWIAQTYYQLAEGLEGDSSAEKMRQTYYAKAQSSFQALLDDPKITSGDPNKLLAMKLQYGQTLRRSGKFKDAVQLFESILVEKEAMIEVQKAAAYTLQEWGNASDATKFDEAVRGTGPRNAKGKKVIWGWSQMGKVAGSIARSRPEMKARFKDLFNECWLNIARVRYFKAMKAKGVEKKKHLKGARDVVKHIIDYYPDMLETPRHKDFDNLVKDIQRAEGNASPDGLKEFVQAP